MNIQQALTKTFATNFVTYYKAHAAHANITGANFYSNHKLLQKIYEELQEEIDTIGELLRTVQADFPKTLAEIITESDVLDFPVYDDGDGDEYLRSVYNDIDTLIIVYEQLEEAAESDEEHDDIANYAQDQVRKLHKFCWMLRSTLGE